MTMWKQGLVIILGVWLMASPDLLGYIGPERLNNHIVGPLVISAGVIALSDCTRAVRWVNVVLGVWLIVAPAVLRYQPLHIGVRTVLIGAAVLGLSLLTPRRHEWLGGGWKRLWTAPQTEEWPPMDQNRNRHPDSPVGQRRPDRWTRAG